MDNIDKATEATQRMKNQKYIAAYGEKQKEDKFKQKSREKLCKNKQSLSKAVARASMSLPHSPRKRKVVIQGHTNGIKGINKQHFMTVIQKASMNQMR